MEQNYGLNLSDFIVMNLVFYKTYVVLKMEAKNIVTKPAMF